MSDGSFQSGIFPGARDKTVSLEGIQERTVFAYEMDDSPESVRFIRYDRGLVISNNDDNAPFRYLFQDIILNHSHLITHVGQIIVQSKHVFNP